MNEYGLSSRSLDVDLNLSSKVELYLSCVDLVNLDYFSKSDAFVVVYVKSAPTVSGARKWVEFKRTETIWDNLNPEFTTPIVLDFHFEEVQELRFEVYDRDSESEDLRKHDFAGGFETTLSRIMGSHGSTISMDLYKPGSNKSRGKLIVRAEEVSSCQDDFVFRVRCEDLDRKDFWGFGKSDPFITISRSREDGQWVRVWKSETIMKNLNPEFKQADVKVQKLCNGDLDRTLLVQVWDWNSNGSHELIGGFTSSVNGLGPRRMFTLVNENIKKKKGDKYKGSGKFIVLDSRIVKQYTLLDYIRGGCEIELMVAIDFTASNGAPSTRDSLHYHDPSGHSLNEYEKAILSVGQVLQDYDSDNQFPVYGFGGQINGVVNHCFPLNFDPNRPEVQGVQGIMQVYRNAFNFVSLSGPTIFSKVIEQAIQLASRHVSQRQQRYVVLLIITDGVIMDIDNTTERIIQASSLPLSIVIVGVGNADFGAMEYLDADDEPLTYNGRRMERDIVQFVPFRKFHNLHYSQLAKETLAEIPDQLLSYMRSKNIVPNPPTLASSRHLAIERSQRQLSGMPQPSTMQQPVAVLMPQAPPLAPSQGSSGAAVPVAQVQAALPGSGNVPMAVPVATPAYEL